MARPRIRERNLDTNYLMHISQQDRDRIIKTAESLDMSVNKFANQAILKIIDLLECETKNLPHTKDVDLIAQGRFLKEHPSLGSPVKL